MSLYSEMQAYRDVDGLYHSRPVGPTGLPPTANGIFTTSIMAILHRDDLTVRHECLNAIQGCQIGYMNGLYARSPRQSDQEAHDDYFAMTAAFWLIAQEVLRYGLRTFFVYNNVIPGTIWKRYDGSPRKWYLKILDFLALAYPGITKPPLKTIPLVINEGALLFRHLDLVSHLKLASAEPAQKLSLLQQLFWAAFMVSTARSDKSNQDGRIIEWFKIQGYRNSTNEYKICRWAIQYFFRRLEKDGLTMASLWAAYVADGGQHPLCKEEYWK